MKKCVGESYTHHNCRPMEKYFLKNAHTWILLNKNQNGSIIRGFRRQGRKEDLGPHIPAPETRNNFCSYAKRMFKIDTKIKNK